MEPILSFHSFTSHSLICPLHIEPSLLQKKMFLLPFLSILVPLPPSYIQPLSAHAWFNSAPSSQMSLSPGSADSNTSSTAARIILLRWCFHHIIPHPQDLQSLPPHESHYLLLAAALPWSQAFSSPAHDFLPYTFLYLFPDLKCSPPSSARSYFWAPFKGWLNTTPFYAHLLGQ